MPMLFAALTATSDRLFGSERLLAFLDNQYVVTTPERTVEVHNVLREELWRHARIRVHHGKTRIWNRGFIPDRCDELEAAAQDADPTARVWWGSHEDRPEDQGITILGTPVGRPEFVESALAKILANHRELLTRILKFKTCSVRGCCCFIVGPPERTSTSAPSDQSCRRSSPRGTMSRCGIASASC